MLVGALQGVVVSVLLANSRRNRQANAVLAALLVAFVLRLVPYIIGYAGFYEAYPWLSFAPFALTLVYGPLIYLYVARVTADRLPDRWWAHLLPAALQLSYGLIVFAQPLDFKNGFDRSVNEPWVDPILTVLTLGSLALYLTLAYGRYRRYGAWLKDATSDPRQHSLGWLRAFLISFTATLGLNAGFEAFSRFVHPLDYFNFFALYAWYAALIYYLALEGWRNASRSYPQPVAALAIAPAPKSTEDVAAAAARWREIVLSAGYWQDPNLTLSTLAEQMGLRPARISQLVNDGLGYNFNEAINRLRIESVQARLRDPNETRSVLDLALEAGFNSKASFNRCFKAYAGTTPTQVRKDAAMAAELAPERFARPSPAPTMRPSGD